MNLFHYCFLTLGLLTPHFSAAVDCGSEVSRTDDTEVEPVCLHFDGEAIDTYFGWYDDRKVDTQYTGMVYLMGSDPDHPENGAAVHWAIEDEYVKLAVAVRATGWVGFGIGEAGGMLGADMVLFESSNPGVLVDAYTTDEKYPQVDDCDGDWELLYTQVDEDEEFMIVEFQRLLNTSDAQDRAIINDASTLVPPHRVIAAWGNSASVGYHGLNVARGAIRFFGVGDEQDTFDKVMDEDAEGSFLVASENHEIADRVTEYAYTCVTKEELIANRGVTNTTDLLNIIGFEPIIQEGNEAYVHHYILSGYMTPTCETERYPETVYVWAPGDGPVTIPTNLGTPLFGTDGFQSFELEVHYNNPTKTAGVLDNSGVRVYWTSETREHQIGILTVGDPNVALALQPVGDGLSYHFFECPGSCSSAVGQTVTVLREYLHMHETGVRITNEQTRDGEVIRTGVIDYWEFDQNGNAAVQQEPFEIQPGDGFNTSCFYEGTDRYFGAGSSQEMCMAFLYYYPRQMVYNPNWGKDMTWLCGYNLDFEPCVTTYEHGILDSTDDLQRIFGYNDEECPVEETKETEAPTSSPDVDDSGAQSIAVIGFLFSALLAMAM